MLEEQAMITFLKKFDEHHLKSIMFPSSSKKNQKQEIHSHYDIIYLPGRIRSKPA